MKTLLITALVLSTLASGCNQTGANPNMDVSTLAVPDNPSPLVGSWCIVKGNELPRRSIQLQFEPDVYISRFQFLPDGRLGVTRKKEVGGRVSFGSWRFIPTDPNEGMLLLKYPRWPDSTGKAGSTNQLDTPVLLRGDGIILENFGGRRMLMKRRPEETQRPQPSGE